MKRYVFIAGLAGFLLASFAFAQNANLGSVVNSLQSTQAAAKAIDKCQTIETKVNDIVSKFNQNKQQHIDSYKNTQTRISTLLTKLEGEGYDDSTVKADLVTYNSMIQEFATDYTTYVSSLSLTKTYTCGKSQGEFKAQLQAARDNLKTVHDDNVALRTYWSGTLKPALLALKDQVKSSDTSTTTTTNTTTEGVQ